MAVDKTYNNCSVKLPQRSSQRSEIALTTKNFNTPKLDHIQCILDIQIQKFFALSIDDIKHTICIRAGIEYNKQWCLQSPNSDAIE